MQTELQFKLHLAHFMSQPATWAVDRLINKQAQVQVHVRVQVYFPGTIRNESPFWP